MMLLWSSSPPGCGCFSSFSSLDCTSSFCDLIISDRLNIFRVASQCLFIFLFCSVDQNSGARSLPAIALILPALMVPLLVFCSAVFVMLFQSVVLILFGQFSRMCSVVAGQLLQSGQVPSLCSLCSFLMYSWMQELG